MCLNDLPKISQVRQGSDPSLSPCCMCYATLDFQFCSNVRWLFWSKLISCCSSTGTISLMRKVQSLSLTYSVLIPSSFYLPSIVLTPGMPSLLISVCLNVPHASRSSSTLSTDYSQISTAHTDNPLSWDLSYDQYSRIYLFTVLSLA